MHIVFQQEDVNTLSKSFELDESLRSEIFEIKDDYAAGPLKNIYSDEGIEERREWWRNVLAGGDYDGHVDTNEVNDKEVVRALINQLESNKDETAWIWIAPNKHDVSGYYWLISQLKDYVGRILVLSLNNLPFINEKGNIFYPVNLFEIPPREFLKAKKLARPVTPSEFEIDTDEWAKLCNENKGIRILEGSKKLRQADYDFYDSALKKYITADWQRASKIIHQFLSKEKETTGDAYLLWRLKTMIAQDWFDVQGKIEGMKDFEIKQKSGELFSEEKAEEAEKLVKE